MVISPSGYHVWVLLVIIYLRWGTIEWYLLGIVTNLVSVKSLVSPKDHLSPEVRVLTALVHRCIWIKELLNIQFVLLNSVFNVLLVCIFCHYSIEVSPDSGLLAVEPIEVNSSNREDVLGLKFSQHSPKRHKYVMSEGSAWIWNTYL